MIVFKVSLSRRIWVIFWNISNWVLFGKNCLKNIIFDCFLNCLMKTHWPLFVLFQRRNWNCRKDGWLTSLWKYFQQSPKNKTIPQKTIDKGMMRYSSDIAEVWNRKLYCIYTFYKINILKNSSIFLILNAYVRYQIRISERWYSQHLLNLSWYLVTVTYQY